MRNQWIGESADYGKYGLLNALCQPKPEDEYRPLSLGVVWYWRPDDDKETNGKPWDYLELKHESFFKPCDCGLYDRLKAIVRSGRLEVASIEADGVFPKGTTFYSNRLPDGGVKNKDERDAWVRGAVEKVSGCDVVFADPDTGLCASKRCPSDKHVCLEELGPLAESGKSLVIYQYQKLNGTVESQAYDAQEQIRDKLGRASFAMVYRGGGAPPTLLLVVPADGHRERLFYRAKAMLKGEWARHFRLIGEERYLG